MNEHTKVFNYKIASKKKRFYAFMLELFFSLIVIFALNYLFYQEDLDTFLNADTNLYSILLNAVAAFGIGAACYPLFSGNIGHRILNIKVIDAKTGNDFNNFFEGGIREFVKNFLSNFILPVIWLFFDKKHQNAYDKVTNTYVVERK